MRLVRCSFAWVKVQHIRWSGGVSAFSKIRGFCIFSSVWSPYWGSNNNVLRRCTFLSFDPIDEVVLSNISGKGMCILSTVANLYSDSINLSYSKSCPYSELHPMRTACSEPFANDCRQIHQQVSCAFVRSYGRGAYYNKFPIIICQSEFNIVWSWTASPAFTRQNVAAIRIDDMIRVVHQSLSPFIRTATFAFTQQ